MSETTLEHLYDAHSKALFAYLLNLTRDETDTLDVMQEVFSKLAKRPELLRGVVDERGYMLRLAHNQAIEVFRRKSSRQRTHESYVEPVEIFAPPDLRDEAAIASELTSALGELPPEQRAVVHLRLWSSLTFERIADVLNIPLNTACSRYRYGLDKLRVRLRPLYDEMR